MTEQATTPEHASDTDLVTGARGGDQRAFAELWRRHHQAGIRVARSWTNLDADDVVSESFTRIYRAIRGGGGPTGAFRPYLYATIRNIAASWGASRHDINVDDIAEYAPPVDAEDPAALALDRTLTARAFRSLPERWQTVLWYTEVEGMDPHEVAPLLGLTANSVAALSYRAREGLRKAWLQAHVSDATAQGECKWALGHLADRARHSLSSRDTERLDFHLAVCAHCAIVSEEVDDVGARLASVLMPLILGGSAGAGLLLSLSDGGAVASAATLPVPDLVGAAAGASGVGVAGAAGGSVAGLGALGIAGVVTAPVAMVGSLALAFTLAGTAVVATPDPTTAPSVVAVAEAGPQGGGGTVSGVGGTGTGSGTESGTGSGGDVAAPGAGIDVPVVGPITVPEVPGAGTGGKVVDGVGAVVDEVADLTDAVVETLTGGSTPPPGHTAPGGVVGADLDITLTGTATPGARLSLQAAGQVYGTVTVRSDGTFTLTATAIPGGLSSLELVQYVDRDYLATLLPGGGVLERVLGTLDSLINALIRPIQLGSGDSRVSIILIS